MLGNGPHRYSERKSSPPYRIRGSRRYPCVGVGVPYFLCAVMLYPPREALARMDWGRFGRDREAGFG